MSEFYVQINNNEGKKLIIIPVSTYDDIMKTATDIVQANPSCTIDCVAQGNVYIIHNEIITNNQNINNKSLCSDKLIFLKITEKYLLDLDEEQQKIILNFKDYKIKILVKSSEDDHNLLFKKYHYLLKNDISEEFIINAVKKYYKSLLFVSENKITDNIIKLAILNDSRALEFVPPEFTTDEIIELAVQKYGYALEYVTPDKMTDKIIKLAINNCGYSLQFVPIERITYEFIKLAVINDSHVIKYVIDLLPSDKITEEIIKIAVMKCGIVLKHIPHYKMTSEIIKLAISNDNRASEFVQFSLDNLTIEIS